MSDKNLQTNAMLSDKEAEKLLAQKDVPKILIERIKYKYRMDARSITAQKNPSFRKSLPGKRS